MQSKFNVKPTHAGSRWCGGCKRSAHSSQSSASGGKRRLAGLRLLLVEDNQNNQQVARELLEDEGAIVQIANHGQEALETLAAGEQVFDVVLMDLQMPIMDGFAATGRIRNELGMRALPIVAMTANAMASDREACIAAGMNDHVGKPFELDRLVLVLQQQSRRTGPLAWSADAAATASAALPPSLATAATMAGVDLVAALHRLGGKTEVYRRMLSRFVPDLGSMAALLDMHAATGDVVSAAQVLHTLKGLAATLGAQGLAVHAAEAEKLLGGGDASADASQGLACVVGAMNAAAPTLVVLLRALENAPAPLALGSIKAFDAQNLVTGLRTLAEQLRDVDMAATDTMAGLRRYAAGTSDARLEGMDDAIGALDFDRARLLCDELLTELADAHLA